MRIMCDLTGVFQCLWKLRRTLKVHVIDDYCRWWKSISQMSLDVKGDGARTRDARPGPHWDGHLHKTNEAVR
jgi:hypothetical protein